MFSSNTSQVSNDAVFVEDVMSTFLYTGNGSTQTITNNIDLSTKGGLVWIKDRSQAASHYFQDTVRGANNYISSNNTNAQASLALNTVFNTDGFSQNNSFGGFNGSGDNYASWTFRKQKKFFDVVTYTGTGSAQNIAHSLGSTPGCIIVKRTDSTSTWPVYHVSVGASKYLTLNTTNTETISSIYWNNTAPTSTQFTVGSSSVSNASGGTYVAYLFAHNAGGFGLTGTDNVIMCGSYAGTGNTSLNVNLGFEPQRVMIKNSTTNASATGWYIQDNMRGMTASTDNNGVLYANLSSAEAQKGSHIVPTATGFTCSASDADFNDSGTTYIYIAIRRGPMKVPTDATTVFKPVTATGNALITTNFPVDSAWLDDRSGGSTLITDRLRGSSQTYYNNLATTSTSAENTGTGAGLGFDNNTGYQMNGWAGPTQPTIAWNWRRAPSFFDEVCYTGNGTIGRTVAHNLGAVPELMIVKNRTSAIGWIVYTAATGATNYLTLNSTGASTASSFIWNNTTPTSSVFTVDGVGGQGNVNASGSNYVAYLFATCAGVSKCTAFTGTGTLQTINCGFTSGARFVLIKRTDSTGDWYVWDSSRGLSSSTDPYLLLNSTAAEVTSTNWVDTTSTGFQVTAASGNNVNINGASYIALAIA